MLESMGILTLANKFHPFDVCEENAEGERELVFFPRVVSQLPKTHPPQWKQAFNALILRLMEK
jgi:hypothetical protein